MTQLFAVSPWVSHSPSLILSLLMSKVRMIWPSSKGCCAGAEGDVSEGYGMVPHVIGAELGLVFFTSHGIMHI